MDVFHGASRGVLAGRLVAFYTEDFCMAQSRRALPAGQVPADQRLQEPKDLDGYFPFTPPTTPAAWDERAEQVRLQIRVALGLWPEPERTPLNAVIHGRSEQPGYSLEKVYFESLPGFFVTGSLYRPAQATGRVPGVLCPHGHWTNGRFTDCGPEEIRKQIVQGAERFELGGRSPLQARCMQLARMGCTVFHYDMVGYLRQHPDLLRARPRLRHAAARDERGRELGPVQPTGRVASAECHGLADLELDPCS
jgi:hypothetical protein